MTKPALPPLVDRLKALAHPVRLRILAMLRNGELCVCEITDVVGLAPSTISQHLSDLRRAGFVTERKEGRWVHYGLSLESFPQALLAVLWPELAGDPAVKADHRTALQARKQGVRDRCASATILERP
ncbi:MAG TPA: metalloregulator ArsR/SmtB family transcription factor [Holophagaceae bacterium]